MRTRAAVVRSVGGPYTMEDVEIGEPADDEVLVRIVACGHCHTDVIAHHGHAGVPMPIVLGHEGAGVVEAVGRGASSSVAVGDHVVLSFASCRRCQHCLSGHPAACAMFMAMNI